MVIRVSQGCSHLKACLMLEELFQRLLILTTGKWVLVIGGASVPLHVGVPTGRLDCLLDTVADFLRVAQRLRRKLPCLLCPSLGCHTLSLLPCSIYHIGHLIQLTESPQGLDYQGAGIVGAV